MTENERISHLILSAAAIIELNAASMESACRRSDGQWDDEDARLTVEHDMAIAKELRAVSVPHETDLERQLAAASTQITDLLALKEGLMSGQLELQRQLAEREAALARCVELLKTSKCQECHGVGFTIEEWTDTVAECCMRPTRSGDCCGNPVPTPELRQEQRPCQWCAYKADVLASLPTSAQATAKVLAAARWISCDEKMPDLTGRDDSHVPGGAPATLYSERVLVFDGTVRIDNLIQAEGSPETRTFYIGSRKPVTHWMPLPEPPEAIREEQEGK